MYGDESHLLQPVHVGGFATLRIFAMTACCKPIVINWAIGSPLHARTATSPRTNHLRRITTSSRRECDHRRQIAALLLCEQGRSAGAPRDESRSDGTLGSE